MNIDEFYNEHANLLDHKKRDFVNRLLNELTRKINQEFSDEGTSSLFFDEILPVLLDAEADDYFGTEGFKG